MRVTVMPILIGALWKIPRELVKGRENKMTIGDYPDYSIISIGQNTEKSPEHLSFSPVKKNHQLSLVWKLSKV